MQLKNKNIVIVGLQSWDVEIGSNCKNIAVEFAKHNKVLYVNYALDIITKYKEKQDPRVQKRIRIARNQEKNLVQVENNIWNLYPKNVLYSINWIKNNTIFDWLNFRNNREFAADILAGVQTLGFNDFILFNDNDIFRSLYLKQILNPRLYMYYIRDYVVAVEYWKHHGMRLEPRIMKSADVVTANSTYLANYAAGHNKQSYYVGQGCDFSLFDNVEGKAIPSDIGGIKKPTIGYVGALNSIRLDKELLEKLAVQKPEWHFVYVGPEDHQFKQSSLHSCKNVHFLGNKDVAELPAYIQAFDVCINPQKVNEVTIGNYPRKIDEYLALGKPTVATKTDAMSIFSEYVYQAESGDEYIPLIQKALNESDTVIREKRKLFALGHTWEQSVSDIYEAMYKVDPKLFDEE